jgi:dTDP-4-dehydrorhamnose reductase
MKVLITGSSGMLGHDLVNAVSLKGWDSLVLVRSEVDITDLKKLRHIIEEFNPDTVIHCAAYTDVDGCEKDPDTAFKVNGLGTKNVAISSREAGASMVYISTDYVFDGEKKEPYNELDIPNPINEYGRSKLLGEYYVQHFLDRFSIVRTSWLFGKKGKNFVKTIIEHMKKENKLTIVDDQIGSPTYSKDLAEKIGELIEGEGCGIYHITNTGSCSWYEFAVKTAELAGFQDQIIEKTDSESFKRPANRPKNSILENRLLRIEGYNLLRSWEEALMEHLNEVKSTEHGGRS